jgi:maleamate amidohydrolase
MGERIWDRYLTEQDRLYLANSPDLRVGFGQRPALLLVDLYRWVFGDEPQPIPQALRDWPGSFGLAGWETLPRIQALLRAAREAELPVLHLTGLEAPGTPGWFEAAHRDTLGPSSAELAERRRRRFDIVDEVAPLPGEAVYRKAAPSGFWGTPLIGQLTFLGVDTLIVAGEATSGCIRATVVDGCTYRFRMIVVEDCVFDRFEAAHALNLFDIHSKYGDVVPLAEVLERIKGRVETRA